MVQRSVSILLGVLFPMYWDTQNTERQGLRVSATFSWTTSNAYFVERFLNELKEQKNIGDSLVTTLDVELQTVTHDALGTNKGAVIVMKPSTGDVLALVSKPDYDPSEIAQKWSSFSNSEDGVLLNRATQGLLSPRIPLLRC